MSSTDENWLTEQAEEAAQKTYSDHNLIVNYLPQSMSNNELMTLFSSVGPVKMAKIIRDSITGISYGYGFVEYENNGDSSKAINALNGLHIQNKRIKVALARQGENIKGANLYVRYLPKNFFQKDLEELFGAYGNIIQARVLVDNKTGLSRGIGFVLFNSRDEATKAKEALDGKAPPGHTLALNIRFAEEHRAAKLQRAACLGQIPGVAPPFLPRLPGVSLVGNQMQTPVVTPRPVIPRQPIPFSGAFNEGFGDGYQNSFSGGPVRSSLASQRFNPLGRAVAPSTLSGVASNSNGTGTANSEGHVLFVYNIGNLTDERALWQLFLPYGTIMKVNVVRDYEKNQGKGYGFVTMYDYQEALSAIQQLNGFVFVDKPLQVSLKTPKTST